MGVRGCWLVGCEVLARFQSSVKYFHFGTFSVLCKVFSGGALLHIRQKDKRPTPDPSPREGRQKPTPALTEKQKDMIPHFISDRRTKGHDTPSLREGRGGLLHHLLGRAGMGFSKLWLPRKKQQVSS